MIAVVLVETQRVGEGGEHLRRRMRVAALLEAHEVVDADPGERRQLGPPQAGSAAACSGRQADLGRRHGLSAVAQEAPEVAFDHNAKSASPAPYFAWP